MERRKKEKKIWGSVESYVSEGSSTILEGYQALATFD